MRNVSRRTALGLVAVMVAALAAVVDFGDAHAADEADFKNRFEANANGAILSIGNSLLTCSSSANFCTQARNGSAYDNNNFAMVQLDADSDSSTFNSSSSELILPDGAEVLFAGLYWGARLTAGSAGTSGSLADADKIAFKVPGAASYETLKGTIIARNTQSYNAYQTFVDVTDRVKAAGDGDYWGANVQAGTGWDRYAGWAMTVAYTAPGLPLRNLTVFDGFDTVGPGHSQSITVSGFTTPVSGPVDAQISMVAYEGDLAQTGDYTKLQNTQLATPVSPGSNFFDSINSRAGASVTTRNPAYKNMLGFDIKNLGAPGVLDNDDSSATFSFSSAGDVYYPGVLALAIDLYAPDFSTSSKTGVNLTHPNRPANPGDTLRYTLVFGNTGHDGAKDVWSCDPLPDGVEYIHGSLELLGSPDPAVTTPVFVSDDGTDPTSVGMYVPADHALCMNLGVDAGGFDPDDNTGGGSLDVLEATFYQFDVTVKDTAGGTTLRNMAPLNYTTETLKVDAVYTTPPVDIAVSLMADVRIVKTLDPPAEAIAGQAGETTLTVTNDGPNLATGVQVTDPLPLDYLASSVAWSSSNPSGQTGSCAVPPAGGVVSCALPDMPDGQQIAIVIQGQPSAASTATSLSNIASVSTTSFDPDLTNNVDTVSVPMTHQADLKITKTPSPQTVTPGAKVSWTLTATNAGPSDATEVVLSDTVPDSSKLVLTAAAAGAGDVTVDCPPTTAFPTSSGFQCKVNTADEGRLRPGETALVKVEGYLLGSVTSGQVENSASVTSATFDPNQGDNITTATLDPGTPVTDIQFAKTGPASAVAGGRVAYTLTATNSGPSDASDVRIVDVLPAALLVDSSTKVTSDRGTCSISGQTVTCDIANLPGPSAPGGAGATVNVTITGAQVDPARTQAFTNTATLTCGGAACNDPTPEPDPQWPTDVTTQADVAVTKAADTAVILNSGELAKYTVTVTNQGPSDAAAVTLTDVLPGNMDAQSIAVVTGSGSCSLATLNCALGTMAPGASAEIEIVAKAGAGGMDPTDVTQTANALSTTFDPNTDNNTATWIHSVEAQADLSITKTSTGLSAGHAGDAYTFEVTNLGPDTAEQPITITDTLPAGVTVGDLSGTGCVVSGQDLTCTRTIDLAENRTWGPLSIPVSITEDTDAGTVFVNTAEVTSPTKDPSAANNTSTVTDVSTADTDLEIDFEILCLDTSVSPSEAKDCATLPAGVYTGPGSTRIVSFHVTNPGDATAKNVQILSNVAVTVTPDQSSLPAGLGCKAVNQQLVCDLPFDMAHGMDIEFSFPFTISPSTSPGTFPGCDRDNPCPGGATPGGWASISTTTPETNRVNNYDTAGLTITGTKTDLRIAKEALSTIPNPNGDGHDTYIAGGKFGYRIDLSIPATWDPKQEISLQAADAASVVLTDDLPSGFHATQVNTGQGTCDPINPPADGSIRCALGRVAASTDASHTQVVSVYVYGTIDPTVNAEGAVNTATATSPTPPVSGADPTTSVTATATTDVIEQADLQVNKLADSPVSYVGADVGYTITTVNNGPSAAPDTKVTDSLPPGLTLDAALSPGCVVVGATADGGQLIECDLGLVGVGASVNTRIVTTTDSRFLRDYWCPGFPDVDGVTCPEVLPPVDITTAYPTTLNNKVEVGTTAVDVDPLNNKDSAVTELKAIADFAVSALVSTETPSAGSDITYTLNGVNLGPSTLDYPVVVSTFPEGFEVASWDVPTMDCSVAPATGGPGVSQVLTCVGKEPTPYRDTLQPGITVPGTVTAHIPADTPGGSYTAESHAYSRNPVDACPAEDDPNGGTCESNYDNNRATVTVNVVETADTSLVKTLVGPNPLVAGAEVVYRLTASNAGPSTARDVTIADKVPPGLTYVSGTVVGGGGTCASPAEIDDQNVVRCQAGALADGGSAVVELTFKVDLHYRGNICNSGLVGSGALDPEATNNTGEYCGNVVAPPPTDVGVTVTPDKGQIVPGGSVGYTAVVRNNGPNPVTGTVVTFTVPPHLTGVKVVVTGHTGGSNPAPACTAKKNVYTCQIGDLWVDDTVTYRVTGTATGTGAEDLTLRAHVTHDDADTNPNNDNASAVVRVVPSGGGGGGGLPVTGTDATLPLLVAAAMVLAGAALVASRRRQQPRHARP